MSKARDLANLISTGNPLSDGAISVSEISDLTASAAELNKLDGVTASTAELNQVVGATSALQTQLDNISVTSGSLTKTFTQNETADITLSQGITSAPVVSATKEVPQTGVSTKGNWDVNSTASNYDFHNTAANVTLTPTNVFSLSAASYDNKSFTPASNNTGSCFFKSDGTKMYTSANINDAVSEFALSTAWDVSTATYTTAFDVSANALNPEGLYFKPDGYKMYVWGISSSVVAEYDLSTAWDVSTASLNDTKTFTSQVPVNNGQDITLNGNGTKLYIASLDHKIYQYSLSTAYDITTATYDSVSLDVATYSTNPADLTFNSDGTRLYICAFGPDTVAEYALTSAYDLSTASYNNVNFDLTGQTNGPQGLFIKPDSTKMYVNSSTVVYQYSTSTTALALGSGSFASTDVGKRIVGNGGDVILTSTSGAFSTTGGSAFSNNSTIAAGSWQMFGLKSAGDADGITMSGIATTGTTFNTTAALESTTPSSINSNYMTSVVDGCISKNGLYFYTVYQNSNSKIRQFTMSTPYDLSTATYTGEINSGKNAANRCTCAINNDGTKFYIVYGGSNGETLATYSFGTAYDVTTLTNTNNDGITLGQSSGGYVNYAGASFSWSADGTKAYYMPQNYWSGNTTVGHTQGTPPYDTGVVYQYNVSTAFNWTASSPGSPTVSVRVPYRGDNYASVSVSSDGQFLINGIYNQTGLYVYRLTTPYDISTQDVSSEVFINTQTRSSSNQTQQGSIGMDHVDGRLYRISYSQTRIDANRYTTNELLIQPTQQYHVGVTNNGGRIDSQYFTDINSMTAAQAAATGTVNYAVSTDGRTTWSVNKGTDGVRPIVRNNSGTWQYNSDATYGSTTWANGSTNDELYTLQQALSVAANRMDKTQLDAIPDANHFSTGTSLDLMIALRMDTAASTLPTSDGVTLNYDAAALNEGAVLGTDYDFFFPSSTKVQIKSLAAQNLKVRVV